MLVRVVVIFLFISRFFRIFWKNRIFIGLTVVVKAGDCSSSSSIVVVAVIIVADAIADSNIPLRRKLMTSLHWKLLQLNLIYVIPVETSTKCIEHLLLACIFFFF